MVDKCIELTVRGGHGFRKWDLIVDGLNDITGLVVRVNQDHSRGVPDDVLIIYPFVPRSRFADWWRKIPIRISVWWHFSVVPFFRTI